MEFTEVLQNPIFWASLIMVIYPKVFDLFEQLLQWLGVADLFSTPVRKTILSWVFAFPVSLAALGLLSLVWPDAHPFEFEAATVLATGIVTIITSTFTLTTFKRRGLLFASKKPVKSIGATWQARKVA